HSLVLGCTLERAVVDRLHGMRGQNDQADASGRDAAVRHWPQSTHTVVPLAGLAAGQRIAGVFAPSPPRQRTCSVSCAQTEQ
ncbi:MAG: hypothetical protein ACXWZ8_01245, partial [Gaiellaceae bacterium]